MSGAVKSVGRSIGKLFGGGDSAPAPRSTQLAEEAPRAAARVATPEERAVALRRRRGARALLSEERMDAETGLAGDQTTLGG
jgi:hypothetical protein